MRNIFLLFVATLLIISCNNKSNYKDLESNLDSTSYSLGMLYASKMPNNLKENNVDSISIQHFLQGLHDYFDSTETPVLDKKTTEKLIQAYFEKMQQSSNDFYASKFKNNEIEGNKFLENNKKTAGITELEKGLQYQILYSGWGELKPDVRDTILVHFKMYDISKKLIYDTRKTSPNPLKIPLDSTIQAWQKVLPLVNTGAKLKIYSSHQFAYGKDVTPKDKIQPYQTLIFDIELVKTLKGNYPGAQQDSLSVDSVINNN